MKNARTLLARHGLDALILLATIEAVVEVILRPDTTKAPESPAWFAAPALIASIAPLLARRWLPFAAPATLWVLGGVLAFVDGRLLPFTSGALVAGLASGFMLGRLDDAVRARAGLLAVIAGGAAIVYNIPDHTPADLVFTPLLFTLSWLAGFTLRERANQARAAESRATQAERERDSAARLAVAEERSRIARELHDIVAHAVSVMVLQVGAVRHKLPAELGPEREALTNVEDAGRKALTEMRRLLAAMRAPGEDVDLAPQPGLDALDALAAEVTRAGLPVSILVEGKVVPLSRGMDLSAYRIVQEALTNALKHARAKQATVTLRYEPSALAIDVLDDGAGDAGPASAGYGLAGIRERVKLYGGSMAAGPAPAGGYRLSAHLPLDGETP